MSANIWPGGTTPETSRRRKRSDGGSPRQPRRGSGMASVTASNAKLAPGVALLIRGGCTTRRCACAPDSATSRSGKLASACSATRRGEATGDVDAIGCAEGCANEASSLPRTLQVMHFTRQLTL